MLPSWRLASFLASLFSTILQNCRILNLVSNLQHSYQIAASAATPPSLFRTSWTIPVEGECAAWPPHWTFSFLVSSFLCASNLDHRFSAIFFVCAASTPPRLSFPFPTVHRFRPSLLSSHVCANLSGRADSFVLLFLDGSSV